MTTPPSNTTGAEPPDQLLGSISRKLDSVQQTVEALTHDIRGNGEKGLKQRVARLESHMFTNPNTGDPGVVRKVTDHEHLISGIRAQMKLLNWLLGFVGTGGVIFFLRAVLGPIN